MTWFGFQCRYRVAQVRYWFKETLPRWIALRLPRKVALFAFVRVSAASGEGPYAEYALRHQEWEAGAGR